MACTLPTFELRALNLAHYWMTLNWFDHQKWKHFITSEMNEMNIFRLNHDHNLLMLLKKTINAYKDIITRSAKFHTKNQFWKDTFNACQEIQERLETNDWNKNVCQTL